ncbi:MAG TPA: PQQ-binding-like beta-propeller repeat protein, partial [Candidatus Limnocylindria bacterium]
VDGTVWVADILNCRVVHLSATGAFLGSLGDGRCVHAPPRSFTSPNAAYPTADGGLLVTEINGSWIDRLAPDGTLLWSVHAPVTYPSDAVPYPDGSVLVADYVSPGQVVRVSSDGAVVWRYDAAKQLHNPSSTQPLAANRVAISDDFGNRILIVDPTTNEIVREYTTAGGVHFKITDCVDFRPD